MAGPSAPDAQRGGAGGGVRHQRVAQVPVLEGRRLLQPPAVAPGKGLVQTNWRGGVQGHNLDLLGGGDWLSRFKMF